MKKHGKLSTESKENNLLCLYCPWLCVPTFEIPRQIERQRGLKRDPENKIGGGGGEGDTSVVTNIVKCKFFIVLSSCSVSNFFSEIAPTLQAVSCPFVKEFSP